MKRSYKTPHRFLLSAVLGLFALLWSAHIRAQTSDAVVQAARMLEGTTFVVPMNQTREGNVDACGFEFKAMTFDNAYKRGDPIVINGSFSIRKVDAQRVFFTLKLGTFNVTDEGLQPEAPHNAWIKLGDVLVKPERATDAESAGYKLYLSNLPKNAAAALDAVVEQKPVSVGFNRKSGGLDVVVPLDLSVRDTKLESQVLRVRDRKLGAEFSQCLGELLASLKQ